MGFDPDLVVVVYVLNDAHYAGGLDLWEGFRRQYENRSLKRSYLASTVYAVIARRTLARKYVEDLVGNASGAESKWLASFSDLRRGRKIAETHGARYAVAIYPFLYALDESHPFRPIHRRIVEYCNRNGIEVVDLFDAFDGRSDTDLWVHPSDPHPNEEGQRIAAEALATFVREHGLLPASRKSLLQRP